MRSILAAEFDSQGAAHRAFLWRGPDGGEAYYTEHGLSTRNAFLRSPVQFSRITSGFTLARFHPFLHKWLAHQGTDFAAPTGTPVRATADGIVTFKGQQTGYGNVVMLKNGGPYSTVFAHLSKFADGLHDGERVHQGDMVGYVGQAD
jgi:murein DD-endopeptidase MepM/ murein hydrolase activator NlpD